LLMQREEEERIPAEHPMQVFSGPRLTSQEKPVKRRVDAYITSEINHTQLIRVGGKTYQIKQSVDLSDLTCAGLTFKRRVVEVKSGACYLMARWKPDRHMRRLAEPNSQKWFLAKEIFPKDHEKFFAKHEQRAAEEAQKEAR